MLPKKGGVVMPADGERRAGGVHARHGGRMRHGAQSAGPPRETGAEALAASGGARPRVPAAATWEGGREGPGDDEAALGGRDEVRP